MVEISADDLATRLDTLLDELGRGEEVVITRRGEPVARLVATKPAVDRAAARAAADRIRAGSVGKSLGGLKIRDLIDEGRP